MDKTHYIVLIAKDEETHGRLTRDLVKRVGEEITYIDISPAQMETFGKKWIQVDR